MKLVLLACFCHLVTAKPSAVADRVSTDDNKKCKVICLVSNNCLKAWDQVKDANKTCIQSPNDVPSHTSLWFCCFCVNKSKLAVKTPVLMMRGNIKLKNDLLIIFIILANMKKEYTVISKSKVADFELNVVQKILVINNDGARLFLTVA